MPTDVIMPALGMAQETGKLVGWLKSAGDAVTKGEPLVEIETDKITVELEALASGTLAQRLACPIVHRPSSIVSGRSPMLFLNDYS